MLVAVHVRWDLNKQQSSNSNNDMIFLCPRIHVVKKVSNTQFDFQTPYFPLLKCDNQNSTAAYMLDK